MRGGLDRANRVDFVDENRNFGATFFWYLASRGRKERRALDIPAAAAQRFRRLFDFWCRMNFALPDELVTWQNRVREFVRTELQPHDASIEETGVVAESAMAGLRRMGLFGTNTPREHGGLGLSMLGNCLAIS